MNIISFFLETDEELITNFIIMKREIVLGLNKYLNIKL